MIRKLLFGTLVLASGALFAQNLDLKDAQDNSIGGYTHYFYDTGFSLTETKLHVSNSSSSAITFGIMMYEIDNQQASNWQVCFGASCMEAAAGESNDPFLSATVPAMGSYNESKVAPFSFGWSVGHYGVWRVAVSDVANSSDSSSAYVVWTAGDTFAGDLNGNKVVDGAEVAGDINGNGVIDGAEITGDMNGDGIVNVWEANGDANGNGVIDNGEVLSVTSIRKKDVGFSVYPNPVVDNLTIDYSVEGNFNEASVDVYDLLGQKVESLTIKNNKGKIVFPVNSLKAGVYFYTINVDEQAIKTARVIVK